MCLPGIEVLLEKLLPKILRRFGKENPSKRRCKVAFVQRKCTVTSSLLVRFSYATYNYSSKNQCMHAGSHECCPVYVRIPETICPSVYGSPVRHQVLRDVTRHFNRPFGNLLVFELRRVIHQQTFQEKLYNTSYTYFLVRVPL